MLKAHSTRQAGTATATRDGTQATLSYGSAISFDSSFSQTVYGYYVTDGTDLIWAETLFKFSGFGKRRQSQYHAETNGQKCQLTGG